MSQQLDDILNSTAACPKCQHRIHHFDLDFLLAIGSDWKHCSVCAEPLEFSRRFRHAALYHNLEAAPYAVAFRPNTSYLVRPNLLTLEHFAACLPLRPEDTPSRLQVPDEVEHVATDLMYVYCTGSNVQERGHIHECACPRIPGTDEQCQNGNLEAIQQLRSKRRKQFLQVQERAGEPDQEQDHGRAREPDEERTHDRVRVLNQKRDHGRVREPDEEQGHDRVRVLNQKRDHNREHEQEQEQEAEAQQLAVKASSRKRRAKEPLVKQATKRAATRAGKISQDTELLSHQGSASHQNTRKQASPYCQDQASPELLPHQGSASHQNTRQQASPYGQDQASPELLPPHGSASHQNTRKQASPHGQDQASPELLPHKRNASHQVTRHRASDGQDQASSELLPHQCIAFRQVTRQQASPYSQDQASSELLPHQGNAFHGITRQQVSPYGQDQASLDSSTGLHVDHTSSQLPATTESLGFSQPLLRHPSEMLESRDGHSHPQNYPGSAFVAPVAHHTINSPASVMDTNGFSYLSPFHAPSLYGQPPAVYPVSEPSHFLSATNAGLSSCAFMETPFGVGNEVVSGPEHAAG